MELPVVWRADGPIGAPLEAQPSHPDKGHEVGEKIVTIYEKGLVFHVDSHCIRLSPSTLEKLAEAARAVIDEYRNSPDIKS